jgi:hypothetical protein
MEKFHALLSMGRSICCFAWAIYFIKICRSFGIDHIHGYFAHNRIRVAIIAVCLLGII